MAYGETLAIDGDGDLELKRNDSGARTFRTLNGKEAVAQRLRVRLGTVRNDNALHPEMGLPRFVLTGSFSRQLLRIAVRSEVKREAAVDSVDNVTVRMNRNDRINRVANVSASVTLANGDTIQVSTDVRTGGPR
jgi:hypothetical protein